MRKRVPETPWEPLAYRWSPRSVFAIFGLFGLFGCALRVGGDTAADIRTPARGVGGRRGHPTRGIRPCLRDRRGGGGRQSGRGEIRPVIELGLPTGPPVQGDLQQTLRPRRAQ